MKNFVQQLRLNLAQSIAGKAGLVKARVPAVKYSAGGASYVGFYRALADKLGELKPSDDGLALAVEASVWAYRCVEERAKAVAQMPWYIVNKMSGETVENHPYHRAYAYAYARYHQNLHYHWEQALSIHGESYLEKLVHYGTALPAGLCWLNPLAIEPFVRGNEIVYFEYHDHEGRSERFYPNQIVFDRYPNSLDDFRGASPMTKALDAVNIDRMMQRYIKAFFRNDATPGGYLTAREGINLTEIDQDRLVTQYQEQMKGADNAFKTILLPAPIEFRQVDNAPPDKQEVLDENQRRRIHAAFFVPMSMTGAAGVSDPLSAGGTMDAQKAGFYESWAIPECDERAKLINAVIMPWLDPSGATEFCFDYTLIHSLIKQTKDRGEKIRGEYRDGLITRNQALEELGYKKTEGGDVLMVPTGVVFVRPEQLAQMSAPSAAIPANDIQVTTESTPQLSAPETKSGEALFISLSLANQPDLIALQKRARELLNDPGIRWTEADDFHITLLYAPSVESSAAENLLLLIQALDAPTLNLAVGSLRAFDALGEHALHFRVKQNADLRDLQSELYALVTEQGIETSAYSLPERYIPHITIGYSQNKIHVTPFNGAISVQPKSLCLYAGEKLLLEKPIGDTGKSALEELKAWEKKVKNANNPLKSFACYAIQSPLEELIRGRLKLVHADDNDAVKQIFADAAARLSYKAIQATRLDFERDFEDLLSAARAEQMDRRRFAIVLRALLKRYGMQAYKDGLADGGVEVDDEAGLDEDSLAEINLLLAKQSEFVTDIGAVIFHGDGLSDAQAQQKVDTWFNGSIRPFYNAGLTNADANGMYEAVPGKTVEHCDDCPRLWGQRHRLKHWAQRNLLLGTVGQATQCEGWECDCDLIRTKGKARGNW